MSTMTASPRYHHHSTVRLTHRGRVVVVVLALLVVLAVGFVLASGAVGTGEPGTPEPTRVVVVGSGDTLWEIAEAYYGGGWHYRAIVRDNRHKIRNPHWIYPRQKFHMPAGR